MEKLEFRVGAKAAKLIGRENIAAVDGALIELVKNAYDADASCVYIKFNMPFPYVLKNTTVEYLERYLEKNEIEEVLKYYIQDDLKLIRRDDLTEREIEDIQRLLFSKNEIIVLDNGTGMSKEIMKTSWMNIAISDKEKYIYSPKGRIKTGAKGIGRFALEKLSTATQVYSKEKNDNLVEWNINWNQFDNANLLNEIKATLQERQETYNQIIINKIGESEFNKIKDYNWNTGTMIIMKPTREEWNERLFQKVNNNMQSINPLGSIDKFDIYIKNEYDNEYDFETNNLEINDFDYRIKAEYDGKDTLKIFLKRNEVNIGAEIATLKQGDNIYKFDLNEFWNREAFKKKNYYREDYNKEIEIDLLAHKEIKSYDIDKLKNVGPFTTTMYFMKGGNSDESIIKKVKIKDRKEIISKFSGIKIYRDKFKVRPYGEKGDGMYDWLDLGIRAQNSPAGIKHPEGRWRVLTYQLIGYVEISRNDNPKLIDMANREGLSTNDEYYIFVELIQAIIDRFEYDRQYVYREYGKWIDEKVEEIDKSQKIQNEVKKEYEKENPQNNKYREENDIYTKSEYRKAIYDVVTKEERNKKIADVIMTFSSAGIITNSFAHEFKAVETNVLTNVKYIKDSVSKLLKGEEYQGDEDYNPFKYIAIEEATNKLIKSWISVIMEGAKRKSLEKERIELFDFVKKLKEEWQPLMDKKSIEIEYEVPKEIYIYIEKMELYSIFNNFFLNSADFLDKTNEIKKKISIKVVKNNKINSVEIYLENNGPKIDEKYKDTPDKIFELGETTKGDEGTGLGLWIMKMAVEQNSGEISVIDKNDGFGIKISVPY